MISARAARSISPSVNICLASSREQRRKMTKFEALWRTLANDAKRPFFSFKFLIRSCQLNGGTVKLN